MEADGSLTAMFGLDKPNIAAVNGLAVGGGSELTPACATIFVADQAEFFSPATAPDSLGEATTGRRMGAEEAAGWG